MKVKIDECLPQESVEILLSKGYNAETVHQAAIPGGPSEWLCTGIKDPLLRRLPGVKAAPVAPEAIAAPGIAVAEEGQLYAY